MWGGCARKLGLQKSSRAGKTKRRKLLLLVLLHFQTQQQTPTPGGVKVVWCSLCCRRRLLWQSRLAPLAPGVGKHKTPPSVCLLVCLSMCVLLKINRFVVVFFFRPAAAPFYTGWGGERGANNNTRESIGKKHRDNSSNFCDGDGTEARAAATTTRKTKTTAVNTCRNFLSIYHLIHITLSKVIYFYFPFYYRYRVSVSERRGRPIGPCYR